MILGLRKRDSGWCNHWMSFYPRFQKPTLQIGLGSYFDNRVEVIFSPGWGYLFLHLPINTKYDECDPPQYGFYLYGEGKKLFDSLVLCLGKERKFIYMPWSLDWVRTSNLRNDGKWEHETKGNRKDFYKEEWKSIIQYETYPYTYVLSNGKVQERTATIKMEEMEWRPRWFKWTSLFSKVRKCIDIEFNDEIGERSGSYKGGTLGCSYILLPNENSLECLRRMEKERKF